MRDKLKVDSKFERDQILTYLELLLQKKGMDDMPPSLLSKMILDLYSRFEKFLFTSVMQNLSKEGYEKFDSFIENNPDEIESLNFLKDNVSDLQGVIKKAMNEFEKVYLFGNDNAN